MTFFEHTQHVPMPDDTRHRLNNALRWCMAVAAWLLCVWPAAAQYDPAFAHYWELEPQYNPAAVGRSPQLSLNMAYQAHATGFEDAGSTMYAGADIALQLGRTRHGLGAVFQNDEIGLFSHKRFSLQYAYHFKLWGGQLSVGAEADMLAEGIDGGKADVGESGDPAIPTSEVDGARFDASVGLWYAHGPWYAGVAMQHVTMPTVNVGEQWQVEVPALYNFTAGYNIKTKSPFLKIVPSVMLRYQGVDFRADLTARVVYTHQKLQLTCAAGYTPNRAVMLQVGGTLHGVKLSYAYEANVAGIGMSSGNHELCVSYRMEIDLGKKGKNKHQSVRFL